MTQNSRYTVIYTEQIMFSYDPLVKSLKFECLNGETLSEALSRLNIDNASLVFRGWPQLEGEIAG